MRSVAVCAHAHYMEGIKVYCRFIITLRRLHKSNVGVGHVNYASREEKNIIVRYTSLGRLLLCSILFLCLLEEGLAHGWLLSDVVGGHYTNATKQTQTVELFRLIIVLVSLCVATSYLDK